MITVERNYTDLDICREGLTWSYLS